MLFDALNDAIPEQPLIGREGSLNVYGCIGVIGLPFETDEHPVAIDFYCGIARQQLRFIWIEIVQGSGGPTCLMTGEPLSNLSRRIVVKFNVSALYK